MKEKKYLNEMTLEELKEKRKEMKYFFYICVSMGTIYLFASWVFYIIFHYTVIPILIWITGITLLVLSVFPNNLNVLIYLKERETK